MQKFTYFIIVILFLSLKISAQSPCTGVPASNTIVPASSTVCMSSAVLLSLANSYTETGITFQWMSSTVSPVGPFSNTISTGSSPMYLTGPITTTTWVSAIITCTNVNQFNMTLAAQIMVAGVTTNTVPYLENFSGISVSNELPNCSWSAPLLGATALTFTTPSKMAAFHSSPSGTTNFYSNGILLHPGVTYSAALQFKNDVSAQSNWNNLQMGLGPTQTTSGFVPIISTGTFVTSTTFAPLSNTFSVQSSGLYYVSVSATSTSSGSSQYLYWDDLSITLPCSLNSPQLLIAASSDTICAGDQTYLTAVGADTYSWNTGSNSFQLQVSPLSTTIYSVTGTNTLTGCSATQTMSVFVNTVPSVSVSASPSQTICSGSSVTLSAVGADNYQWSSMATGSVTVVAPMVTTSYSVLGSNSVNCTHLASILVNVIPLPNVVAVANKIQICEGDTVTLVGSGANTYTWTALNFTTQGNPVYLTPNTNTTYTITGTANTCVNKSIITVNVDPTPLVAINPSTLVMCNGATGNFSAMGANSYTWSTGSNGSTFTITPTASGIFTVTVTGSDLSSCKGTASATLHVDNCTSIQSADVLKSVTIYPSPGNGIYFLRTESYKDLIVRIYNLQGTLIFSSIAQEDLQIDLSMHADGIYFGVIQNQHEQRRIKLIKQ